MLRSSQASPPLGSQRSLNGSGWSVLSGNSHSKTSSQPKKEFSSRLGLAGMGHSYMPTRVMRSSRQSEDDKGQSINEQDELKSYLSGVKKVLESPQYVESFSETKSGPSQSSNIDWLKLMEDNINQNSHDSKTVLVLDESEDICKSKFLKSAEKSQTNNCSEDLRLNDATTKFTKAANPVQSLVLRCSETDNVLGAGDGIDDVIFQTDEHKVSQLMDAQYSDSYSPYFKGNIYSVDELYTHSSSQSDNGMLLENSVQLADLSKSVEDIKVDSKKCLEDTVTPPCFPSASPIIGSKPARTAKADKPVEVKSFRFSAKSPKDTPYTNEDVDHVVDDVSGSFNKSVSTVLSHYNHELILTENEDVSGASKTGTTSQNLDDSVTADDNTDYTMEFSDEDQRSKSDLVEDQQGVFQYHNDSSCHEQLKSAKNHSMIDAYVQTSSDANVNASCAHPTVTIRTQHGNSAPVVLSADAIEAVTAYSQSAAALNDMLRLQLHLTQQQVNNSKRLLASLSSSLKPNYHYTTLESTKHFIAKNRPKIITLSEVKKK